MRPPPCWSSPQKLAKGLEEPIALPLGLGTCVGAFLGGRLAADLDEDHMKLGFGGVMLTLGARTLLKAR